MIWTQFLTEYLQSIEYDDNPIPQTLIEDSWRDFQYWYACPAVSAVGGGVGAGGSWLEISCWRLRIEKVRQGTSHIPSQHGHLGGQNTQQTHQPSLKNQEGTILHLEFIFWVALLPMSPALQSLVCSSYPALGAVLVSDGSCKSVM